MHVSEDDIARMLQIQQLDLQIVQTQKKLEAMPQRATIMNVRAKRRVIQTKQLSVNQMREVAEAKLAKIEQEDETLCQKAAKIQQDIEAAQGDYRNLGSRTKELEGVDKRRKTLEADLQAVGEEIARVDAVQAQVDAALGQLDATEAQATKVFVEKGTALRKEEAAYITQRDSLKAELAPDVCAAYEKASAHAGGVGIARLLDNGSCGACRSPLDHGRVLDLKRKGNVGICPHCQRLLVL